ncbi:Uma2 family endonuclease [Sphingomonas radiodurans]|uniref:Uma2 family endonuclease n=1 Tax=Sphingomonas radiodurans TaxID=2890321 RepID=UPI001E3702DE|nr:Uma2 family endonuclease [Sphingomonas radiodurans]WBH17895.1 Uma2 family endonuclease [Sphingomonas radiodurans]
MTVFQNIRKGLIPARLTVDEVYALTEAGVLREGEHFELIDGEIVPMAAAKADWHSIMVARLNRALVRTLPEDVRLFVEASITLSPTLLLEPDLAVWRKDGLPRSMRGPDILLLIEVADSSLSYDLRVKAPLYAAHGVREYWVVDAVRRTVRVHRDPREGVYQDVEEYDEDVAIAPLLLDGVMIRLDTLD